MTPTHAFNIFINLLAWAAIISLLLFIVHQFQPEIQKWLKIAGAVLLVFVIFFMITGGIHIYPFLR